MNSLFTQSMGAAARRTSPDSEMYTPSPHGYSEQESRAFLTSARARTLQAHCVRQEPQPSAAFREHTV